MYTSIESKDNIKNFAELILEVVLYPIMITKYQLTNIWKPKEEEHESKEIRACLEARKSEHAAHSKFELRLEVL